MKRKIIPNFGNVSSRILSLLLALIMVLGMVPGVALAADSDTTVYLKPNSNWTQASAWFAVYYFDDAAGTNGWADMTDADGNGYYEATIPAGYSNIIFVRMDPAKTALDWSSKWTQTANLIISGGNNCYSIKDDSWDSGTWSVYTHVEPPAFIIAGSAALFGVEWDPSADANRMSYNSETRLYEKTYSNVAEGTYELKVTQGTWEKENWGNNGNNYSFETDATSNVKITFNASTKAIGVEVTPIYSVTFNGTNVTSNGAATATAGSDYTATLTAAEGYTLPETVTVTVGGDALTEGYTYDSTTGALTIPAASVTGDIVITAAGVEIPTVDYYLIGYINGADYGCNNDHANLGNYKFVNGEVTATFTSDSYVFVKTGDNANWYMSEGYAATSPAILYNTSTGLTDANKLFVPGGVEVTFTLVDNGNGTLTLSYITDSSSGSGGTDPETPTANYYVAGDKALTGKEWDAAGDLMTYNSGTSLYEMTYSNVAAGTYNLKVTDGTWTNSWGDNGSNYTFKVSDVCDVTVTFDPDTKTVSVTGDGVAKETGLEITSMHAVGNGSGNWMNGKSWDVSSNAMTETSESVYEITFTGVAAGSYEYKFAANGAWTHSWGGGGSDGVANYNGQNIELSISYTLADVTLKLDLTNYDHSTKTGATYSVTVTDASSGGSQTPATVDYYLVGYINGADNDGNDYKFVDGSLTVELSAESYVLLKDSSGQHYIPDAAVSDATTATLKKGNWDYDRKVKVPSGKVTFTLTVNGDGTLTLSYTTDSSSGGGSQTPATVDYYLVGYLNSTDYDGTAYQFENGKLTTSFTATTYVYIKDSNGKSYMTDGWLGSVTEATLSDPSTLNKGDKLQVPTGTNLEFTLVDNGDGTLTLSYAQIIETPEIPEGYNTVTIHFLKPSTWGSSINAWIWDANGKIPGYEDYNTAWPGSPIPANTDKAGWYDITVGTAEPQSFNFIFNDGSSQTADLTTGKITGPTELWVVDGTVYTTAPREWTHYTATIHFQKPDGWGDTVNAYAWTDVTDEYPLGAWPGTVTSPSANGGWYNTIIYVEIGRTLNFIFNDGTGNQTGNLTAGKVTGNIELWINGNGESVSTPEGWVDENRTIHLPGTLPGPSWDAASNQMTYDPTLGLYTITFKDVTAGTYYYKIAVNGGWGENYGANGEKDGDNMSVNVPSKQDVTFWYNDSTHRVVCSVDYDIDAVITLSGTGIDETKLTDPELDGQYSVQVTLPAGTYSDLTITHGDYTVVFSKFTLSSGKDVTFYYDPATGLAYHNGSDVKVETDKIYYNTKDLDYKDPFGAVATGEDVTFSITTGTDATAVVLAINGLSPVKMEKDGEAVDGVQRWTCTTSFASIGEYEYYFAITNGSDMVFYCDDTWNNYYKTGDYGKGGIGNADDIFAYDLVVYEAGYKTPDWMKNAVIYQIFPDRFFDGDETNNQAQIWARGTVDYEYITDWYLLPENPEMADNPNYPENAHKGDGNWSNEIYGGDLEGIVEKIDYLKALGVNVIYLNPVFWSISNHRYDAVSYTEIDPILGTLGDFEELVAVAEANDMHIILDGVFNHVSDDSVYFDRYYKFLPDAAEKYDGKIGAYPYWAYVYDYMAEQGVDQATAEAAAVAYFGENYGITDYSYTEWFAVENKLTANKDTIGLRAGKYVYTYEGWWGYDSMPVIYSTNGSEYQTGNWAEEILSHENENSVNAYWISKGMDGWRLDVANEVSDETWQNFRDSVKALDSEAVIIGEIWADATHYLMGDMYDSVMNYVFRDAVAGFARGYLINRDNKAENYDDSLTADEAMTILEILRERYPEEAFYAMMNLVASHDTSRILSYLDDVEDDRYQKDIEHAFPTYEGTSDRAKELQYVVAFLQFTYAGAPTIYYGDEIGMVGGDDPDDRRAFTWGMGDQEIVEWYATLAAIRAAYPALRTGSVEPFSTGNVDVMGFVRSDDANTLVVLANRAASAQNYELEGTWVDLISGETFTDTVTVPAYRGVILVAANEVKTITVDTENLAPAYDSQYIVAERHIHDYEATATALPTCIDQGYTIYACTIDGCEISYEADYVDPTGIHSYGDWTQTKAPTISSEGEERRDCIHCDAYETQPIPVITVTLYTITKAECKNGSVTAQAIMAAKGSTIKVSAVPAEGYKVVKLVVTDAAGNEIEVVDGKFEMPASNVTVSATFVYDLPYTDVADDNEHYAAIAYMYETGLMIGTSTEEYIFNGDMTMTRAQIAMILYRLADEPAVEYAGIFTDAPEGAWYTAAVEWAHAAGIVVGVNETEFAPAREITVNELAALIYRYAQCQLTGSCTSTEDDWTVEFAAAMTWCVENGVLSEDISASAIATRYLAAEMFYSVYSLLNK